MSTIKMNYLNDFLIPGQVSSKVGHKVKEMAGRPAGRQKNWVDRVLGITAGGLLERHPAC